MSEFDGPIMATLVQNNAALRAENAKLAAERDAAREYGLQARLREKAAEDKRIHDTDALRAQNAALVAALKKLSNEVLGSLPLMEAMARQELGNSNYSVLIQRAEEARAALAAAGQPQGSGG